MSTLVAQTISNGTVSTSSANVIQGSAKAWVNFNGVETVAIRGSFNVSSITDGGTGTYTVNLTNALPDVNYSAVVSGAAAATSGGARLCGTSNNSSSAIFVQTKGADSAAVADLPIVQVAVFR
jgi:hypothetical protein